MTKRLSLLAEKYKCAILLIGHMNKAGGNKAAYGTKSPKWHVICDNYSPSGDAFEKDQIELQPYEAVAVLGNP